MSRRIAIIVAGGSGARMGASTPKQFMQLGDKPVLIRTVERFVGIADRIVVVLPRGEAERWRRMAAAHGLQTDVCEGGKTRLDSVRNALAMVAETEGVIAVHDGVRPLASRSLVERVFAAAERHGAAVPVVEAIDSFRLDGEVVDRDRLRAVQTPQAFNGASLRDAYMRASGIRVARFTDDASVFEMAGHTLHFVEGERTNIKITTPSDLTIAEALL